MIFGRIKFDREQHLVVSQVLKGIGLNRTSLKKLKVGKQMV